MLNPENHLKNATRVMRLVGWLCFAGLPLFALLYPPGVLWGEVSPHDGLHPYFYMVAAMYVSYGFLMIIGARKPQRNVALFDYGIAANVLHGGIMIPMAFYYPNEHAHMWFDIPFAFLVAALCYVWHPDRLQAGITRSLFWWIPFGSVADIPAEKLDSLRLGGVAREPHPGCHQRAHHRVRVETGEPESRQEPPDHRHLPHCPSQHPRSAHVA